MNSFPTIDIQYVLFVVGLFWLYAGVCLLSQTKRSQQSAPALNMALFVLLQGFSSWSGIFTGVFDSASGYGFVPVVLMVLSYGFLLGFSFHWPQESKSWKYYFAGILLMTGVVCTVVATIGFSSLFFCLILLSLSVFVTLLVRIVSGVRQRRHFFLMLVFLGLKMGMDNLQIAIQENFIGKEGWLVGIIPAGCVFMMCFIYCLCKGLSEGGKSLTQKQEKLRWIWLLLIISIAIGGIFTAKVREVQKDKEMRREMGFQVSRIAQMLDPALVKKLTFTEKDKDLPAYQILCKQLQDYSRYIEHTSLYSYQLREGKLYFGPENLVSNDSYGSPPGTLYEEPDPNDFLVFKNKETIVFGPQVDEYGIFMSGVAPVLDQGSGKVLMVLGVDVEYSQWENEIRNEGRLGLGVFIVLALILSIFVLMLFHRYGDNEDHQAYHYAETVLVLLMGVFITAIIGHLNYEYEIAERNLVFRQLSSGIAESIREEFDDARNLLESAGRYVSQQPLLTSKGFHDYLGSSTEAVALQGLAWVPKVEKGEISTYLSRMKNEGAKDYKIYDYGLGENLSKSAPAMGYFPIAYISPANKNISAPGFNLISEPDRQRAIQSAIDHGYPVASHPLSLVGSKNDGKDILMVLPVFMPAKNGRGTPTVKGVVVLGIEFQEVLQKAISRKASLKKIVDIQIYDISDAPELVASYQFDQKSKRSSLMLDNSLDNESDQKRYFTPFFIYNRSYLVAFEENKDFYVIHPLITVWQTVLAGMILTVLLAIMTAGMANRRLQLEKEITLRTQQLDEHLAFLDAVLNSLSFEICVVNELGTILKVNNAWREFAKLGNVDPREVSEGANYLKACQASFESGDYSSKEVLKAFHDVVEGGIVSAELECPCHSGDKKRWFIMRISSFRAGMKKYVVIAHHNITDMRKAEEKIRQLSSAIEQSPLSIVVTDICGTIEYVNPHFSVVTGYTSAEAVGQNPRVLKSGFQSKEYYQELWQTIKLGKIWRGEFQNRKKSGEIYWESATIAPIKNPQGEISNFVAIKEDITAKRMIQEEMEKLALVANKTTNGVVMTDSQGRVLWLNEGFTRLTGYEIDEMKGKKPGHILQGEETDMGTVGRIRRALAREESFDEELVNYTKQGQKYWVHLRVDPVFDEKNRLQGFIAIETDVTGRKDSEAKLLESERRFRFLADHTPVLIWMSDINKGCVYFNQKWLNFTGRTFEQEKGNGWTEGVHPDDLENCMAIYTESFDKRLSFSMEYRLKRADGEYRWITDDGTPRFSQEGEFLGYIGACSDITARKQAEQIVNVQRERLKRINQCLLNLGTDYHENLKLLTVLTGEIFDADSTLYVRLSQGHLARLGSYRRADLVHNQYLEVDEESHSQIVIGNQEHYLYHHSKSDSGSAVTENGGRPCSFTTFIGRGVELNGECIGALSVTYQSDFQLNDELSTCLEIIAQAIGREEALHEADINIKLNEEKFRSLFESSLLGMALNHLDSGRFLQVNTAFSKMTGYTSQELVELDYWQLTPLKYKEQEIEQLRLINENGVYGPYEKEYMRKDGTVFPVLLNGSLMTLATGERRIWSTIQDISDIKKYQRELQDAKAISDAANRAKSAFLATMSHEIRTPMNAIIGMSSILMDTPVNHEQKEYLETIRISGDSLLSLINDILDYSKIEAGKIEFEKEPFDLSACLLEALQIVAGRAAEKNLELSYIMDENTPSQVLGDVTRLRQILLNLLSNAVKFTQKGEVSVSLKAQSLETRWKLIFTITDTGIGMDETAVNQLFRPFQQGDSSITRRFGGTGLGLVISKRLVELMEGCIHVKSELGKGSTFEFEVLMDKGSNKERVFRYEGDSILQDKKILIVDDNPTNCRMLEILSLTWGMVPTIATGAREALELMNNGQFFDLGLFDYQMPEISGEELAKRIKELYFNERRFPIILCPSLERKRKQDDFFDAVITKPLKPSDLHDVVITVLTSFYGIRAADVVEEKSNTVNQANMSVLVVEDNMINQKVVKLQLKKLGVDPDMAVLAREAIEKIQRKKYDLVLMDIQMPEMDGIEATKIIRQTIPWNFQPGWIIALTANAMQGDREACLSAGMNGYLAKPIKINELEKIINKIASTTSALVDRDYLQSLVGSHELKGHVLLKDIFATFENEIRETESLILKAIDHSDAQSLRIHMHKLSGGAASAGLKRLAEYSKSIENNIRLDEPVDFQDVARIIVPLIKETSLAFQELIN